MTCMKPVDRYPIRTAFQLHYPKYSQTHMVPAHKDKVAKCISMCKTGDLGYNASYCEKCGYIEVHACSCNNKCCPNCQSHLEKIWVANRESELIEGIAYYHVVFTVPAELNSLIYVNQKLLYSELFKSSSATLMVLCQDKKYMGATPGLVAVLHTHGAKLNFHPHIHYMVSGGGLNDRNEFVETAHKGFLIPQEAMAKMFRGKFLDALKKYHDKGELTYAGECLNLRNSYNLKEFIDKLYKTDWIPEIKETFNGKGNAAQYLGRYIYRIAISNSRIISVDKENVTFRYKDYADNSKLKEQTMTGEEFIGAFLQHVPPPRFSRVRFYGFLANCHRAKKLILIHKLRGSVYKGNPYQGLNTYECMKLIYNEDFEICPCCRSPMKHKRFDNFPQSCIRTLTTAIAS